MAVELKNKMIVGGLWYDPNEHRDDLYRASPDYWETVYYVLDLNTGEVSSLPRAVVDDGCLPYIGVVGSILYLVGGAKSVSTKPKKNKRKNQQQPLFSSQMLDLTKPQDGWRLAAAGLDHLWPLDLVVFGGKIYVFGNSDDGFICEVFDPQRCKWCRLKSPPFPPAPSGGDKNQLYRRHLTLPVMADYKRNRIIVYFQDISTMYAYYPCEDQWRCVVEGSDGWYTGGQPVTFADDGVIYIHSRRLKTTFFRAYDTITKDWLNVRLSPEAEAKGDYESYLKYEEYRDLVYRGNGLLCLLTSLISDPTFVYLVQFKVELVKLDDNSKEVLVTPHSSQYYHLHTRCSPFLYLPV